MAVKIKIPISFRRFAGGKKVLSCKPGKISVILEEIFKKYPEIKKKIFNDNKVLISYIVLFLDDQNINHLRKLDTVAKDGQTIKIIPMVGGG